MEQGCFLGCVPRSGLGFKYLRLANTFGVVDSDYFMAENEGHIMAKVRNEGLQPIVIKKGMAFFQVILQKYYTFENEIQPTQTRNGGFGSTDEKRN